MSDKIPTRWKEILYFHLHPEAHPDDDYVCDDGEESQIVLWAASLQVEAHKLSDLLCPVHASLDANGELEPFDNCMACIRNERDELRTALATAQATIERLSAPVNDEECRRFESSYGEKLMLNYVEWGLSEFTSARKEGSRT